MTERVWAGQRVEPPQERLFNAPWQCGDARQTEPACQLRRG